MSNINIWIRPALDKRQNISRDAKILKCVKDGMTYTETAKKFNLSCTRVEQIVREQTVMRTRRANYEHDELLSNRTIKILYYSNITSTEQILALSEQDIYMLRGAGKSVVIEVQDYQKALRGDVANG